jgi:hypothetical protein
MKYVLITVAGLIASYGVYRLLRRKSDSQTQTSETVESTDSVQEEILPVEEKIEKIEETAEQMTERLNSIKSVDSEKPFATLSKTSVAETPETVAEVAPKPKKKRPYKKRGPKKEVKKED